MNDLLAKMGVEEEIKWVLLKIIKSVSSYEMAYFVNYYQSSFYLPHTVLTSYINSIAATRIFRFICRVHILQA